MAGSSVYQKQRRYFRQAYVIGQHGWPIEGATPDVVAYIRRVKKLDGAGRALDLGCGEGRHSIALAKEGFTVHAVDYEPLALKKAKNFAQRANVVRRITFELGEALNLRYPRGFFELVLDYGCFHHVLKSDWKRYFGNILRVLKDDGYFLLSVFSTKFKHHEGEKRTRKWLVHRNHYDRFFTPRDIRETCRPYFNILALREERNGLSVLYHTLMRKK